jgi:hypothetical protein
MAPDTQTCAISASASVGIASGLIQGPFTFAMKTFGPQVTQKRE